MRRLVSIAILLCLLGAGCGGDSGEEDQADGPRGAVTEAVDRYQAALRKGDGERACELTYLEFRQGAGEKDRELSRSERDDCAREVEQSQGSAKAFELEVTDVRVQGESATAKVRPPKDAPHGAGGAPDYKLRRFDGQWKVAFLPN